MPRLPFVVVRVRPLASPLPDLEERSSDLSDLERDRLSRIGEALADCEPNTYLPLHVIRTVPFATTHPGIQKGVETIAEKVEAALSDSLCVIVDLRFDPRDVDRRLDDIQGAAVRCCVRSSGTSPVLTSDHRLLLLVNTPLADGDRLAIDLEVVQPPGRVAVLDRNGTPSSQPEWAVPSAVFEAMEITDEHRVADMEARLIRRRGVFEVPRDTKRYVPYHYLPILCLESVVSLLYRCVERHGSTVLIYQPRGNSWLQQVVKQVCQRRIPNVAGHFPIVAGDFEDIAQLASPDSSKEAADAARVQAARDDIRRALNREGARVLIVVPMTINGTAIRDVLTDLRQVYSGHVDALAIMIYADQAKHAALIEVATQDEVVKVEHFLAVDQRPLTDRDWQLRAAQAADAVEDMDSWSPPSLIGLWSLFEEVGCGDEEPIPQRRQRPGLKWFPRLKDISDEDALWLAESIVRLAEEKLKNATRANLLIVLPDEPSGVRKIARALTERMNVAVVAIQRSVIEGDLALSDDARRALVDHRSQNIVIVDESTVTYGSLERLTELVLEETRSVPQLKIVVLETSLNPEKRPNEFASLISWRPVARMDEG